MRSGLEDKVVLITGASGGIGRALAVLFAEEGARLALHAHSNRASLQQWVDEQGWKDRAVVLQADVRDNAQVESMVEKTVEAFGRLDVAVANSGVWPEDDLLLHEMPEARIRDTLEVNLLGAVWTARAFLKALARSGPHPTGHGASLIFIGSTAGRFGERHHGDYSVSKAGMYGLVRTLKNEIARVDPYGRVNMVEPGWTATPMAEAALENDEAVSKVVRTMALRQIGRPEDIARAVGFLASPLLARHVSGEVITVAGGMEGRTLWSQGEVDPAEVRRRLEPDRD